MRADLAFRPGEAEFDALRIGFRGKGSAFRTEADMKWIRAGFVAGTCASGSMCGLKLAEPLPGLRAHAWFRAFRDVNADCMDLCTLL